MEWLPKRNISLVSHPVWTWVVCLYCDWQHSLPICREGESRSRRSFGRGHGPSSHPPACCHGMPADSCCYYCCSRGRHCGDHLTERHRNRKRVRKVNEVCCAWVWRSPSTLCRLVSAAEPSCDSLSEALHRLAIWPTLCSNLISENICVNGTPGFLFQV